MCPVTPSNRDDALGIALAGDETARLVEHDPVAGMSVRQGRAPLGSPSPDRHCHTQMRIDAWRLTRQASERL